jgi:hypothetical protein
MGPEALVTAWRFRRQGTGPDLRSLGITMRLHTKCATALLAAIILGGLINAAHADTALQQFNDIYGDRVRKATASRDTRQSRWRVKTLTDSRRTSC